VRIVARRSEAAAVPVAVRGASLAGEPSSLGINPLGDASSRRGRPRAWGADADVHRVVARVDEMTAWPPAAEDAL
jgi:hypothetical protein